MNEKADQWAQLFQPPKKAVCSRCRKRKGTIPWGDMLALTHGFYEWRCESCALEEQIEHARERAKALPGLEQELARLKARSADE